MAELSYRSQLTDLLVRYRWLFVVPVVLPMSVLFDLFWAIRNFYYRRLKSAPKAHERRVRDIQEQLYRWREAGSRRPLCTARKPWMNVSMRVVRYKQRDNTIKVDLYDILEIDTERTIVRVEPGVTIGQLTRYLNPRGWTLPVVPELDDLTVSGLVLGYGIESSSHRYGLFADIVDAYEVVIGDATVVRATREMNATNQPTVELSLQQAVLAYREEYLVERGFGRLKGRPLSLTPLYLETDDCVTGLLRPLLIALRVLCLLEFSARKQLAAEGARLKGIYLGNPKRATACPTTELMLRAFAGLTLITQGAEAHVHLTPLSEVQQRILQLLGLSPEINLRLTQHFSKPLAKMSEP